MRYLKANLLSLEHLPTWMMCIGLPLYWLEMYLHQNNHGVTTPIAWIVFFILACMSLKHALRAFDYKRIARFFMNGKMQSMLIVFGVILCLAVLVISLYAALLPPHLIQEDDVLNYHYTFPRQHLIRNSFAYIPWSTCDLFPYPVQSALAPFWFATELPNKLPQFFFMLAVPFLAIRLLSFFGTDDLGKKILLFFAIIGAHHFSIQAGTAMLDIVLAYLFLAALDSLLRGNWILATVEFVFYFWSKSFIPFQVIAVGGAVIVLFYILKKFSFTIDLGFATMPTIFHKISKAMTQKIFLLFVVLSVLIAGPFMVKSLGVSGTPLYPFFAGSMSFFQNTVHQPWEWNKFIEQTNVYLSMQEAYGLPRTIVNFLKHFWLIAVPMENVNNIFDYPVGLVYLLCIGPFVWFFVAGLFRKKVGIIPMLVILMWALWWLGSQQTRFLYIPLLLMYAVVIAEIRAFKIFYLMVVVALFFTSISMFRAHRPDMGKSAFAVLRLADQNTVKLNEEYLADDAQAIRKSDYELAAYAQFPVWIVKEKIPYIISIKGF